MIAAAMPMARSPLLWVVGGAWTLALGAQAAGLDHGLHHDVLGRTGWVGIAVFAVVWQVHVLAMMVPSSLPTIRLFGVAAAGQDRPAAARASFLSGYLTTWTIFGIGAIVGDGLLHRLVHAVPALDRRPWIVLAAALVGAGVFQFSGLKDRCLRECRLPQSFLRRHYRRGVGAAFRIGARHGLVCLGCCWALMLAMFALGVANVAWMAPFAALMYAERLLPSGDRLVAPAGVALIAGGAGVLVLS